jgi:DNA recombination protein RmuC
MAIGIVCTNPSCRKALRTKDEFAGRLVKCPGCGNAIRIPALAAPTPAPREPTAPALNRIDSGREPNGVAVSKPIVQPPDSSHVERVRWPWISGVIALSVVLVFVAFASLTMTPQQVTSGTTSILIALVIGLTFGGSIGVLITHLTSKERRARLEAEVAAHADNKRWIESTAQNQRDAFELLVSRSEAVFARHASMSLKELNDQARAYRKELSDQARVSAEEFAGRITGQLTSHAGQIGLLKNSLESNITHLDQYVRELESKREGAYATLRETFEAFSSQSLVKLTDQSRANSDEFSGKIGNQLTSHADQIVILKSSLETNIQHLDAHVRELEGKREGAYSGLTASISTLQSAYCELRDKTEQLTNALKAGPVRGRWGEIQLEKILKLAGMDEHISYDAQSSGADGRPDIVVRLPRNGNIPVDSKFICDSYLEAMASSDPAFRKEKLLEHSRLLRQKIKELSQRKYWEQFTPSPELVIMFVPIESILMAAYESDPEIIEFALSQKVMLASPITLLGFLKAIAYGWQHFLFTKNAKKVFEQGKELYKRLDKWLDHYRKTGEKLNAAVEAYNASVGSLHARLYPCGYDFQRLAGIVEELTEVERVEHSASLPIQAEALDEPI